MAYDLLSGWLEEQPSALYSAYTGGMPTGRKNFYKNLYGDVYSGYLGGLASDVMKGKMPTTTWTDFLKNYDWGEEWGRASPSGRGERQTVYNPARQWRVW